MLKGRLGGIAPSVRPKGDNLFLRNNEHGNLCWITSNTTNDALLTQNTEYNSGNG